MIMYNACTEGQVNYVGYWDMYVMYMYGIFK